MQLKWLEDLIALAQTGSFTRAAEARNVTHPAFGRRIRALEDWAGAPLVDRAHFPARLTAEGQLLLDAAHEIVVRLGETRRVIQSRASPPTPTLFIATGRTLARTWLPARMRALQQASGCAVRISTSGIHDAALALENGDADLLICYHHAQASVSLDPQRFEHRVVAMESLAWVGDTKQFSSRRTTKNAAAFPYIAYAPTLALGRVVEDFLAQQKPAVPLAMVCQTDFAEAAHEMALRGVGTAWLPLSIVDDDLARGSLCRLSVAKHDLQLEIRVYRTRASATDERSALIDRTWTAMIIKP
jgi:LysR family transcriptional regulator, hypochlorite-specific transcription factor HypT